MSSASLVSARRPFAVTPDRRWGAAVARTARCLGAGGLLLLTGALGAVSTVRPALAGAACVVICVVAVVALRPEFGAYLVVAVSPLIAGIDRGHLLPLIRPSEALVLLVGAALILRAGLRHRTGFRLRPRLSRLEAGLVLMAACNSILPLLCMAARHRPITQDDILYALVLWKFLGIYAIVRASITTNRQVALVLCLSVGAACLVAVIAILQSLNLFGVPHLLSTYYAPFGYTNLLQNLRGSSTTGIPAATADLMVYNLAIVGALWVRGMRPRFALGMIAILFVVGALSAGEFSSAIGLVLGVVCLAVVTSNSRLLGWFLPAAGIAFFAMRPVIENRLSGFQSSSGLPVSWTGRLANLQSYFWPRLFSDGNFLFGVQPAARVPVPAQGTGYVWIESGYTWLLWGGGIPLLLGFCYVAAVALKSAWTAARTRIDMGGVVGVAVVVSVTVMSVLMVFDPHLTYRGAADELFVLLALLTVTKASGSSGPPLVPAAAAGTFSEVPRGT
ncbi:MAG: hypothetical protein ABR571_00210 [Jatrophihabitans sp.]|uniref:hypothetical protein n=1 Tax=Jatrophihabitans sp. TaxID=1932789 RepID=UPI0039169292